MHAIEVCSRRGSIQIHICLTLPYCQHKHFDLKDTCCNDFDYILCVCVTDETSFMGDEELCAKRKA